MGAITALGIMSGTSLDGVDFVLCRLKREPLQLTYLGEFHSKFPNALRTRLLEAAQHKSTVDKLAILHHDLGRFYAREVKRHSGLKRARIDLAGLHGQTVFHKPPVATLQIGEPSYLAAALGAPVIADFRVADLALHGQGAPLATILHAALFQQQIENESVAVHNLGGISNVSYFQRGSIKNLRHISGRKVLSFDTGPANMLIDLTAQRLFKKSYDKDGRLAAAGAVNEAALSNWMKHPYFRKHPPKSCGREEFGEVFYQRALNDLRGHSPNDKLATFTEFTAMSIAHSYRRFLPELPAKVYLCGGGAKNPFLISRIQHHLPESKILTTEDAGWPVSSIEGAAFALMAALRY
ncbi:MAG TPA: anhydro-N-acetylmuramic acid kinase, partial [Bdellovibrionales bacterium]|nr:anhydro-N-acetylmuramic acid kinase [Bdellovibrionales bacterium]